MQNEKFSAGKIYFAFVISLSTNFSFPLFVSLLLKNGFTDTQALSAHLVLLLCSALILPLWGHRLDKMGSGTLVMIPLTLLASGVLGVLFYDHLLPVFLLLFALGAALTTFLARRIMESKNLKGSLKSNILKSYILENVCLALACLLAMFFSENYKTLLMIDFVTTSLFLLYLFMAFYKKPAPANKANVIKYDPLLLLKDREILLFIILLVITFSHMSSLPLLYNRDQRNPIDSMAIMLLVNTITIVVTSRVLKSFPALKKQSALLLSSILLSLGFGLGSLYTDFSTIVASSILWSIAETLLLPLISFEVINKFHESDQGMAVGVKELVIKGSVVLSTLFTLLIKQLPPNGLTLVYLLLPVLALGLLVQMKINEEVKEEG